MSQLGGRDEALPQEAPEGSSTFGSLPCELPRQLWRCWTKSEDGAPSLAPLLGPLGGQHWQRLEMTQCAGPKGMKAAWWWGRCSTCSDALRAARRAAPRGYSLSSWRKIVAKPWLADGIKGVGAG